MLMNALFIHKYTKGSWGNQIHPHISLYTLSMQKIYGYTFRCEIVFLYINYIQTPPAHIPASMDTDYRGRIAIILRYRRRRITKLCIWVSHIME